MFLYTLYFFNIFRFFGELRVYTCFFYNNCCTYIDIIWDYLFFFENIFFLMGRKILWRKYMYIVG